MVSPVVPVNASISPIAVVQNSVRMEQESEFTGRHSRVRGNPVFSREHGNPESHIDSRLRGNKVLDSCLRSNDGTSLAKSDKTFGICYKWWARILQMRRRHSVFQKTKPTSSIAFQNRPVLLTLST
jgi:hypothetical protein